METELSASQALCGRDDDWRLSNEIAVVLAVVWIATRRDAWIVEAQRSADRLAFMKALQAHEDSWRKPVVSRMAYTLSQAELELELDLASGILQATGKDNTGFSVEIPRKSWNKDLFLDAARDCALNSSAVISHTNLRIDVTKLLARYEPRDAFARRVFQRSVWNAQMTAHWIEERSSSGFYDVETPLGLLNNSSRFHEACRSGQIIATIDGKDVPPDTWFAAAFEALQRKAQFNKADVVAAFPYVEDPRLEREIVAYLDALPEGTATLDARLGVEKRFKAGDPP